MKFPGGGGGFPAGGGGAEGPERCLRRIGELGGGGAKYFFSGPKCPPSINFRPDLWKFRRSTELESGNAIGAFLQTPAPVLDKIPGPMGTRFLSSTWLGSGDLIGRAQFPPAPALDKIGLP